MTIAAGTRLDRYEILSLLGKGGMGEVYLARDTRLDRQIALKLLPARFTQDEECVRRFEREAKAASALNHPNIITIHEIGEIDGTHFMATEFIDGQTLRQQMKQARMMLEAALNVSIQVASALTAAHAAGIVHRDIKPENLMLRGDGVVKVLDFGLAKLTEGPKSAVGADAETLLEKVTTHPGAVLGTPQYMSPEQARGEKADARSDIFSLGIVLYEMIAGRPPFKGANAIDVIGAILRAEAPPLKPALAEAPESLAHQLEHIVTKALRKDREARYQTIKDLQIDLKDLKEELIYQAKSRAASQVESGGGAMSAMNLNPGLETDKVAGTPTNEVSPARTTSSAEYLVSEIKHHKLGAGLALALLVIASTALYFFFPQSHKPIDSLAVLPFVNVGSDPNTEYLSDGITESLINQLSQLPQLKVIARSSSFKYKGKETDPQEIAKALSVEAIVTGRVTQRGDHLLVSAELVNTRDRTQMWGEQYERPVSDLLAVQREIAKEISGNLRLKLSGAEQSRVTKHYTENPEAYQLYLKGRFYLNQRATEALKKSIEYFNQAIEKDPSYALAYAGMAEAYVSLPGYSVASPQDAYPKAKAAAKRALELDEALAEAHTALADVLFRYDWNFPESHREFQRAIELNPNYATAHQWYGHWYLLAMGRFDEAIAEGKRAQELDPLSLIINRDLGSNYLLVRQYDKAIEVLRKTIEMDQSFPNAHWTLSWAYALKGSFPEALAEYRRGQQLDDNPAQLGYLTHLYAVSGQRDEALKTLDQMKELAKQRYIPAYSFVLAYAGLGEKDQAFAWLERGYQDRDPNMTYLKIDPFLDNLHSDPRFADLVRRIGLPQ